MFGPVQSDSMSRCEDPSSLYSIIRNPNARNPPQSTNAVSKDTIESIQQRMNREVLDRFKTTGLKFSHESYVAVAQVGKYVFMAIMLPPYLCMYGIPRWLIATAVPQVFAIIKTEALQVGKFFQTLTKNLTDLMKGILQQMLGDALRFLNHQSRKLWFELTAVRNTLLHPLVRLEEQVALYVMKAHQELGRMMHHVKEKFSMYVDRATQLMGEKISAGAQLVNQHLITPIMNMTTPPVVYFAEMVMTYSKILDKYIAKGSQRIHRTKKSVAAFLTKSMDGVLKVFAPVISPIALGVQSIIDSGCRLKARISAKIKKPIINASKVMHRYLSKITSVLDKTLLKAGSALMQFIVKAFQSLGKYILPFVMKFLKKQEKKKGRFQGVIDRIVNKFTKMVDLTKRIALRVKQGCIFSLSWLKKQLILLPGKIGHGTLKLLRLIRQLMEGLILSIRFAIAVIIALCNLCVILIRHLCKELINWIPENENGS